MFLPLQQLSFYKVQKIVFLSVILTVFLSVCMPGRAFAEVYYPDALDIRPVQQSSHNSDWLIEYLKPGQIKEETLQISNLGNQEKKVELTVQDAVIDEKKTFSLTENGKPEEQVSSWIKLSELEENTVVTLVPGEKKLVTVHFQVPSDLKAGLYPGAVIAKETVDNNGSPMIMEKGVRLYANVLAVPTNTSMPLMIGIVLLSIAFVTIIFTYKKQLKYRPVFHYVAFCLVAFGFPLVLSELPYNDLKTQVVVDETPHFYTVTVEWGRRSGLLIPDYYSKTWDGNINITNAQIDYTNPQNLEHDDKTSVINNNATINFHTVTSHDTDGMALTLRLANPEETSMLHYVPDHGGKSVDIDIKDILHSTATYTDGLFEVRFHAEIPLAEKERIIALKEAAKLTQERMGSGDVESSPVIDENSTPNVVVIPELGNLFTEELPASPEALSNVILNSGYIDNVVTESNTQKIQADSQLIEALASTPDVLSEITASEDANILFVPTETVNFPSQDFSFDEEKSVSQDLGTLVFVNNKTSAWNTYLSISDFKLLSGDSIIPASAVTIDPGKPLQLSPGAPTGVIAGTAKTFTGENDKSTLITVSAGNNTEQEVFALHPKLQIRIPAGTPAGTYQATMKMTTL